jgi:signal-transduction protein with cAMP-binding, CBS, and nucleotidyltransferase domain
MACDVQIIKAVPLFALLDDEELAVLAEQVELAQFTPRQRIYRINDPGDRQQLVRRRATRQSGGVRSRHFA